LCAIRQALAAAGAQTIDAPILQPLNLLLDLAGEAMRARLFVVQAEGEAEACLRPDFTAAVVRQHVESGAAVGRYVYEGPAFRSEPEGERRAFRAGERLDRRSRRRDCGPGLARRAGRRPW
jgi:ATP phosphoribosyltransferase regulatory subunit